MATRLRLYLAPEGFFLHFWSLIRTAASEFYINNCLGIAKGAAFSALLAFFPLLTTLAALLVEARAEDVARTIASFLYEVVPPGTQDVVLRLFVVKGQRPVYLLVVAVIFAVWAASGTMMSLMEGFHGIYHTPSSRSFLRERVIAILLVFVATVPVLGASALVVFGSRAESAFGAWLGHAPQEEELQGWAVLMGQALRYGLSFVALVLVTAFIYYIGPNRRQTFRGVFPGAMLATVLWLAATLAFGWYFRYVANYNVLYGSVGAGLALLVWMYVLAIITLYGCEFNAVSERLQHPRD
jgi:membrane protein